MSQILTAAELLPLFINGTPLIDVRSPVEFKRGAFPHAINLPLLNDDEREAVGKAYKVAGQQAAIDLGHRLVSGDIKQARLQAWQEFIAHNPQSVLYCFRGGIRSRIAQEWLTTNGVKIARVDGGYKRMRRLLLESIDRVSRDTDLLVVAGKTGSGKTHIVNQLHNSVDLEGIANHRGSAFGTRISGQPTQIDFENRLAIAFLRQTGEHGGRLFLEDESRAIGSLSIPQSLYGKMLEAPIAVLEQSVEQRVNTILKDYIVSNFEEFKLAEPKQFDTLFGDYLRSSLAKISRRLGGEKYQLLSSCMEQALNSQQENLDAHRHWIRLLLELYYDPMYDYQLGKKSSRVVFRGDRDEFLRWAARLDRPVNMLRA